VFWLLYSWLCLNVYSSEDTTAVKYSPFYNFDPLFSVDYVAVGINTDSNLNRRYYFQFGDMSWGYFKVRLMEFQSQDGSLGPFTFLSPGFELPPYISPYFRPYVLYKPKLAWEYGFESYLPDKPKVKLRVALNSLTGAAKYSAGGNETQLSIALNFGSYNKSK